MNISPTSSQRRDYYCILASYPLVFFMRLLISLLRPYFISFLHSTWSCSAKSLEKKWWTWLTCSVSLLSVSSFSSVYQIYMYIHLLFSSFVGLSLCFVIPFLIALPFSYLLLVIYHIFTLLPVILWVFLIFFFQFLACFQHLVTFDIIQQENFQCKYDTSIFLLKKSFLKT